MTATLRQAKDEMLALFNTEWTGDVISQNVQVIYEGVHDDPPKDTRTPWARVAVRHNPVQPGAVAIGQVGGRRRFRRDGIVFVQLFTGVGDGQALSDDLCTIVRRAFEGQTTSPGNVIFRTVSVAEIGVEDRGWYQANVSAQFEYDEIV